MAAEQLPEAVREFTDHLRDLLARLDRYAGWCLVFWQRDPDGMRACLEGREPPPWDVMESLLQDLAAVHGPAAAVAELPRSRALHAGATAAFESGSMCNYQIQFTRNRYAVPFTRDYMGKAEASFGAAGK